MENLNENLPASSFGPNNFIICEQFEHVSEYQLWVWVWVRVPALSVWVCVCLCWCCDRDSPVLFTMPSTGCCSLRLDYCRAEPTFGAAERELRDVSHFPHKPQSGLQTGECGLEETHPWPSGRTFLASQALEKTNHNSTSTSAYFLFGRRLSFVTPLPPTSRPFGCPSFGLVRLASFWLLDWIYDRIWSLRDTFSGIFYFALALRCRCAGFSIKLNFDAWI